MKKFNEEFYEKKNISISIKYNENDIFIFISKNNKIDLIIQLNNDNLSLDNEEFISSFYEMNEIDFYQSISEEFQNDIIYHR